MDMAKPVLLRRVVFVLFICLSALSIAGQETHQRKETYTVGPRAVITVTNECGPITIRPSSTGKVQVTMVWDSPSVEFVNEQRGNRLELRGKSNPRGRNMAQYIVLIPSTDMVTVRALDGDLVVQGLRGDLALETSTSAITISDVSDAHIKARTLSGTITLKEVHRTHLDIYSAKGDIHIHNVGNSWLEAHSSTGKITYDGDPGLEGEYQLFSHFGDLEVSIPSTAVVVIKARSFKFDQEIRIPETSYQNSFLKSHNQNASRFRLRSLRGDIRVSRP
jgi:hypothetical protein